MKLNSPYLVCSKCNTKLDGALEMENSNNIPNEGDFSICYNCGTIGQYCDVDENMFIKPMSEDELNKIQVEEPKLYDELIKVSEYFKNK